MLKQMTVVGICLLITTGCAARRPVLYPNETYRAVGTVQAQEDVAACIRLAEEAHAQGRLADEVAERTAKSALVGGATGAVVGAIGGSALRGGLIGAAAGGTAALVGSALRGHEESPVFRRFVEICLYEKGYQVLGWQ